jgi:hypothetical protein
MGHDKSTRLRIKLGPLEFEFEGDDNFLQGEVPKLLKAADDLQVGRIGSSVSALTRDANDSLGTHAEIAKLVDELKAELNSMGGATETQLRLQMMMDRMSKALTTLSNVLKKMSDTAEQITQNIK